LDKGFIDSKSKIDVSLNQNNKVTSEDIIKNLNGNNNQNQNSNRRDTNSKKNSKSKDEQPVINSSNNESILSMKLESDAIDINVINGIKSNSENSVLISTNSND